MTSRLAAYIISNLSDVRSFTSAAREVNLSISTVIRVFDCVNYGKPKQLPKVVSSDEFKGNTDREKYQCILTDPETTGLQIFSPPAAAVSLQDTSAGLTVRRPLILSVTCGVPARTLRRYISKMPYMSSTNTTLYARFSGLLKPFERKNRKSSAKPEEFTLSALGSC